MTTPLRLADTGTVYVTLRAAREYAHSVDVGEEEARRELTTLLLDARRRAEDAPPYERWRLRRGPVDISAMVSRDGPLAVVVTVDARRKHAG